MEKKDLLRLMTDYLHMDKETPSSSIEATAYLAQEKGFNFPYHFWWEPSGRVGCLEIREDLDALCSYTPDDPSVSFNEYSTKILDAVHEVLEENDPVLLASLHFLISRNQLKTKEKEPRINEARELFGKYKRSYFYPELKRAYDALETEGLLR